MAETMKRCEFLRSLGLGMLGSFLSPLVSRARAATVKPSILFLFTDDQRFSAVRAMGCPEISTPVMDALMAGGTTFTNAYIMGGSCGAVCMPSRAMLMTGRGMFHLHGKAESLGAVIPPEQAALPEAFRQAGYATFHTGKWHQDKASFSRCFASAERIFFGGMSDHYNAPLQEFDPSGKYPKEKIVVEKSKHDSTLFSDSAAEFLRKHKGDQPFFLYVAYKAPHDPRQMPERFRTMYDPAKLPLPLPPNFMPEHPFDNGEMKIRDEKLAKWPRTPEEIRQHLADYYGITSHLDFEIGRVLEALKETGHADDTIVVFCSDNGLAVGQHGLMGKQNLYEHSIRVPLVLSGPGIRKGEKRDGPCYLHDIFPTLCELTGAAIPASVESRSLAPVLRDEKAATRNALCFAYRHIHRGLRAGRWKLILYNVNGQRTTQLFDLQDDPWEMRNLAEAQPDRVNELTARLQDELRKAGDSAELAKPDWGFAAK